MRGDEGQAQLRFRQGAVKAARTEQAVPGRFVTGEERNQARHEAREQGISVSFSGGWDGAEREQVCFHPDWTEAVFTAVWVEIRWAAKFSTVSHADLLGSLMALGMDRSLFGDLMAEVDRAYLCALPEAARRLTEEWQEAGRVPLKVTLLDQPPLIRPPKGEEMRDTVASLRLDCVLSSGLRVSRTRAAEIIRQGLVQMDHTPTERPDALLTPGTLLSVRGFGRIRLETVGDRTRKDRLPITLSVFRR